jgi:hypothetical protein
MVKNSSTKKYAAIAAIALLAVALAVFTVAAWHKGKSNDFGTVQGNVSLGPTCPVERMPQGDSCADKPYAAKLALTADGKVVKEFDSKSDGTFSVQAIPGTYTIRSAVNTTLPSCTTTQSFVVKANQTTTANVSCDSGIR